MAPNHPLARDRLLVAHVSRQACCRNPYPRLPPIRGSYNSGETSHSTLSDCSANSSTSTSPHCSTASDARRLAPRRANQLQSFVLSFLFLADYRLRYPTCGLHGCRNGLPRRDRAPHCATGTRRLLYGGCAERRGVPSLHLGDPPLHPRRPDRRRLPGPPVGAQGHRRHLGLSPVPVSTWRRHEAFSTH